MARGRVVRVGQTQLLQTCFSIAFFALFLGEYIEPERPCNSIPSNRCRQAALNRMSAVIIRKDGCCV